MLSGGTDITVEVPPDNVATFTAIRKFTFYEQAGPHLWYLLLNTKDKPFDDKRVRQAANYAINKDALVNDILKGTATVAAGPTPPAFTWAHDNAAEALSVRSGEGQGAARGSGLPERRRRHLLRDGERLGHAVAGADGHGDPGRPRRGRHPCEDRDV